MAGVSRVIASGCRADGPPPEAKRERRARMLPQFTRALEDPDESKKRLWHMRRDILGHSHPSEPSNGTPIEKKKERDASHIAHALYRTIKEYGVPVVLHRRS
jgi:hypothetical protein